MTSLVNAAKRMIAQRPLITNCIFYGTLYVGAEFTQQVITKKILATPKQVIDKANLGRYAIMGTVVNPPLLYTWYKWLDTKLPGTSKQVIIKKLIADQCIQSPVLLVVFFVGMALLENSPDPFRECREKFVPTYFKAFGFWFPIQVLNFTFIQPQYRVIFGAACAFVWMNILCWVKSQQS